MAEILETIMLICFGCSWPLNLKKNIASRTAKNMSLPFILLIVFGYVAGISAKLVSGRINYVLAAYIINLLFVLANIPVYIRNRKFDKEKV